MTRIVSRRLCCITAAAACCITALGADISIEPPHWWTGMSNDTLQLMMHAPDINGARLEVDYPGVKLTGEADSVSPNYKIAYMTIAPDTRAGDVPLTLTMPDGKRLQVKYPLLRRDTSRVKAQGFDAGDVLYLIMPDRFADGDPTNNDLPLTHHYITDRTDLSARHGGDIAGIRQHLGYIDSLGVTTVWVNPVLTNDMPGGSYHGYATTDYYNIDPRLGTNDEWRQLVSEAHDRGIKVVMDMIFNHTGSTHMWMSDMPMTDWYNHPDGEVMTNFRLSTLHDPYASNYDTDATVNGWFVLSMPDLNQRNRHLLRYLIQNSIYWVEESGIDGIRMDTYPYADERAMARWIDALEAEYPDLNIVGECWYGNEGGEAYWQRGSLVNPTDPRLKTVMDFKLSIDAPKAFSETTGPWGGGLNAIYDHLSLDYLFPDPQHILTFLDNHDTDRFLATAPVCTDSLGAWRQAQALLLTTRGIPQIYYGTELLMAGTRADGGDGNVRRDMPGGFSGDSINIFDGSGMTALQHEAYDYLRRLLTWRRTDAVRRLMTGGTLKHFIPSDGAYVYERRLGDSAAAIILNGTDAPLQLATARYAEILPAGTVRRDIISGRDITIGDNISLSPRQTLILVTGDLQ